MAATRLIALHQNKGYSQFNRIWNYIRVRGTQERTLYKYVNGRQSKRSSNPSLARDV